jgi:hypothetical protein
VVDTTASAQPAPPPQPPKHRWMVPGSWSEWVASAIILGVVAICAFFAGEARFSYVINDAQQRTTELQKQYQEKDGEFQREKDENKTLADKLAATDNRLGEAFNAYRTIVLNGNDTTSVSTGHFTVGLVGPPANDKVSINVNGTKHTVAAGDSIDVGISNCRVEVQSFDMFKVTLLTSCPPAKP